MYSLMGSKIDHSLQNTFQKCVFVRLEKLLNVTVLSFFLRKLSGQRIKNKFFILI